MAFTYAWYLAALITDAALGAASFTVMVISYFLVRNELNKLKADKKETSTKVAGYFINWGIMSFLTLMLFTVMYAGLYSNQGINDMDNDPLAEEGDSGARIHVEWLRYAWYIPIFPILAMAVSYVMEDKDKKDMRHDRRARYRTAAEDLDSYIKWFFVVAATLSAVFLLLGSRSDDGRSANWIYFGFAAGAMLAEFGTLLWYHGFKSFSAWHSTYLILYVLSKSAILVIAALTGAFGGVITSINWTIAVFFLVELSWILPPVVYQFIGLFTYKKLVQYGNRKNTTM